VKVSNDKKQASVSKPLFHLQKRVAWKKRSFAICKSAVLISKVNLLTTRAICSETRAVRHPRTFDDWKRKRFASKQRRLPNGEKLLAIKHRSAGWHFQGGAMDVRISNASDWRQILLPQVQMP
jgi:hypothetical protein